VAGRIARGDVRLYGFAPPDKKRPVVVLTHDSAISYLSTVSVASIGSIPVCHGVFVTGFLSCHGVFVRPITSNDACSDADESGPTQTSKIEGSTTQLRVAALQ